MANEGVRSFANMTFPTGVDATKLSEYALQDGTTFLQVAQDVDAALSAMARTMATKYGKALSFTDRVEYYYRQGVSNGLELHTEFALPEDKRGATTGHSIAYREYDRGLGWSWDYLRSAWRYQLDADIADFVKDHLDKFEARLLRRMLNDGEDTGDTYGLGSGYSPGWALSGGTLTFTPVQTNGKTFASTHDHFDVSNTSGFTNAIWKTMRLNLKEHGHEPPFEAWCSDLDEDTIRGLSDFTPINPVGVRLGATQDVATVSGEYIGVIQDFYVKIMPRVTQYYVAAFKSYGNLSQRNPILCRVEKGNQRPAPRLLPGKNVQREFPIENLQGFVGFGFGVKDRTGGVAGYTNSASWSDPSITGA